MNVVELGRNHFCINTGALSASFVYHKAEKFYDKAYQVFINLHGLYTLVKDEIYLPSPAHSLAHVVGYIGVVDIIFAGPRLVTSINEYMGAENTWDSVHSLVGSVSEFCNVVSLAAEIVSLCKELGVFAKEACGWVERCNYVFLPSQFILLGQSLENTVTVFAIRQKITPEYIKENEEHIKSSLSLSKKCQLQKLPDSVLSRRINTTCVLAIADSISTIASTILCVWCPQTQLGMAIYTATVVSSLAQAIFSPLALPKHP